MGQLAFRRLKCRYLRRDAEVWVLPQCFLAQVRSRSGFVWDSALVPFVSGNGDEQLGEILRFFWRWPVKRKDSKKIASAKVHASPGDLSKQFPQLSEFMTAAKFEGEQDVRESPTITVWCSGGLWRCSVKDRAEGLVMWLSAETPRELMDIVEGFVFSNDAPWRHDDQAHERNGKRVRKSS